MHNGGLNHPANKSDTAVRPSIYRAHQYEELPEFEFANPNYDSPSVSRSMTNGVTDVSVASQDRRSNPQQKNVGDRFIGPRSRENPLYTSLLRDKRSPYLQNHCCQFNHFCSALAVLIALVAICLSITSFLSTCHSCDSSHYNLSGAALEVEKLRKELALLRLQLEKPEKDISLLNVTVQEEMSSLRMFVRNVSKLPGPQGPPGKAGAGNLSSCRYDTYSHGGAAQVISTKDVPLTSTDEVEWVITGLSCSSSVDSFVYIVSEIEQGYRKYHCDCKSQGQPSGARQCHMHVWKCPRIS